VLFYRGLGGAPPHFHAAVWAGSLWSGFHKDAFAKAARGTCIRSTSTEEYGVKQILID